MLRHMWQLKMNHDEQLHLHHLQQHDQHASIPVASAAWSGRGVADSFALGNTMVRLDAAITQDMPVHPVSTAGQGLHHRGLSPSAMAGRSAGPAAHSRIPGPAAAPATADRASHQIVWQGGSVANIGLASNAGGAGGSHSTGTQMLPIAGLSAAHHGAAVTQLGDEHGHMLAMSPPSRLLAANSRAHILDGGSGRAASCPGTQVG
jgi:hypothetical protein